MSGIPPLCPWQNLNVKTETPDNLVGRLVPKAIVSDSGATPVAFLLKWFCGGGTRRLSKKSPPAGARI